MNSALKCPACQSLLKPEVVAGVTLDHCPQCGGFWLDDGETQSILRRFSQLTEIPSLDLHIVFQRPQAPHSNPQRRCPRCNVIMQNINYAYNSNIFVDRCPQCHGLWTDAGELPAMVQYVKGNPKLDRLASAILDHVRGMEKRRWLQDSQSRIAILIMAVVEAIRHLGRLD